MERVNPLQGVGEIPLRSGGNNGSIGGTIADRVRNIQMQIQHNYEQGQMSREEAQYRLEQLKAQLNGSAYDGAGNLGPTDNPHDRMVGFPLPPKTY